jgi:hypothetical protein
LLAQASQRAPLRWTKIHHTLAQPDVIERTGGRPRTGAGILELLRSICR